MTFNHNDPSTLLNCQTTNPSIPTLELQFPIWLPSCVSLLLPSTQTTEPQKPQKSLGITDPQNPSSPSSPNPNTPKQPRGTLTHPSHHNQTHPTSLPSNTITQNHTPQDRSRKKPAKSRKLQRKSREKASTDQTERQRKGRTESEMEMATGRGGECADYTSSVRVWSVCEAASAGPRGSMSVRRARSRGWGKVRAGELQWRVPGTVRWGGIGNSSAEWRGEGKNLRHIYLLPRPHHYRVLYLREIKPPYPTLCLLRYAFQNSC